MTAGLDYSRGDAVVIIDADLQDPPELILEMAKKWREGYEVVYAVRAEREGESWFKLWTASMFYRAIYRITDVKIPLDTGDFRLMDRKVVDVLKQMKERHRFPRGMSDVRAKEALEAIARGKKALETRAFNAAAWPVEAYENAWKHWQPKPEFQQQ